MDADAPHILVIEDDADTRANLADILDLDGYRVTLAGTFAEAQRLGVLEDVNVVLLDRRLPDGTAERLLPAIRREGGTPGIIVITGYRDLEGALACLREGVEDFILKPLHPEELRLALRRIIRAQATQRALEESETRLRAVVNTAVDAIITIDENGVIASFNPAAEKLFGYTAAEAVGRNVNLLMPAPYHDEHDAYLRRYETTGERRIIGMGREVTGRRRDGSTFPIELAVSEVRLGGHRLFTGIIRDLTERHRLMNQIVHIAAEEQQRIGHDLHDGLGQELTGISLLTGSLRRSLAEADRPEAEIASEIVSLVNDAVAHLRGLVKGLCPVKLQADGLMLAIEDLAQHVESRFHVACEPHFPQPVSISDAGVATHLYYITREAVHNAVRHARPRRISIQLAQISQELGQLAVTDDGVGFPESAQLADGRGLPIMAHRARMINGSIETRRANERGGTLVRCTFPYPC